MAVSSISPVWAEDLSSGAVYGNVLQSGDVLGSGDEEGGGTVEVPPTVTTAPTQAATPSAAPEPTKAPTQAPSETPEPTKTPTQTPSVTPEPTKTPTQTPSVTPEPTRIPTQTPSETPEPTKVPTETPTVTPSATPSVTETPTPTPTQDPEKPQADIILKKQGASYSEKIYLEKEAGSQKLAGIRIETCEGEGEDEIVTFTCYWSALNGSWSLVDSEGNRRYLSSSGSYNLLDDLIWNIQVDASGVSKGADGYVLNFKGSQGMWNYCLTAEDAASDTHLAEISNELKSLPAAFFVGVCCERAGHSGLQTIGKDTYYLKTDGTILINGEYTDEKTNTTYHFGADGKCDKTYVSEKAGWIIGTDGNYYWRQEDGTILREGGFHVLDGQTYFLNPTSGRRRTGWITWGGKKYYLDPETAVLMTGMQEIDEQFYYLHPSTGAMMTGWQTIDGKKYYFLENGTRKKGWLTLGDKKYYFEKDGEQTFGWRSISQKRYYFDLKTGAMRKGWLTIGNNKYYLEKDGSQTIGWRSINQKKYYFVEKTGLMKKGWLTLGENKYYFEKDGTQTFGWRSLGGKRYYFLEKSGLMKKGWLTLGKDKYYFNRDGSRFSGIRSLGGKKYYFQSNGKLLTDKKYYQIGSSYYNIASDGVLTEVPEAQGLAAKALDQVGWNLYAAFKYSAGLDYSDNCSALISVKGSEADAFACYGFKNEKADSYVMASTFYEMAKILGYEVYYVKGSVPLKGGNSLSQGWCEIVKDGKTYVCDPYFYYEENRGGYMFQYGQSGTWRYENYKRQND